MKLVKKIYEGWHGEIYLTDRNTVIKKFKKGLEKNYEKEKEILLELKDYDFVPKIISWNDEEKWIEMEYIEGKLFRYWDKEELLKNLEKILDICYLLDKKGIKKEEFHRPFKHIALVGDRIVLFDWERAKKTNKSNNLNQFIQYLIDYGFVPLTDYLIELLKEYKKNHSKEIYEKLKEYVFKALGTYSWT